MDTLLDYRFGGETTESAGGGHALTFKGALSVAGPPDSQLGPLASAIRLTGAQSAKTSPAGLAFRERDWTVRVVFRTSGVPGGRQNLVESDKFPFALFVDAYASQGHQLKVVASVNTSAYGWRAADSRFARTPVVADDWMTVDAVYQADTLVLLIDGVIVDVQAFPKADLVDMTGDGFVVGSWVDLARNRFSGELAAVQLLAGVPDDIAQAVSDARRSPQWFISRKRLEVEPAFNLGDETGGVTLNRALGAYQQTFERGLMMYHDGVGAAFEMHGLIWERYKAMPNKGDLGYLISDESNSTRSGARKSLFSQGGIYWSPQTGAYPVTGRIWLAYEDLGEAGSWGLPHGAQDAIAGGNLQVFDNAEFYYRSGAPSAFEVHGDILKRFKATGGVAKWGYPTSNETDVLSKGSPGSPGRPIGRMSTFEGCTFYWSGATGAFEVHGDIRAKHDALGGPGGDLGFPTSDESDIPGVAGAGRINSFQNGSLCWYGDFASMIVARPFKIFVGRLATQESEGFGMGQNDLYCYIRASDGGQTYDKRHPGDGDWGGNNSRDINLTLPNVFRPTAIGYQTSFRFQAKDADPGNDDDLGTFEKVLNAANGWGLRENQGVFNERFAKVNALTWSVKPEVNLASLSETQKWWGTSNPSTAVIPYGCYAQAFRDVDSEAEWWDPGDWLEKAFYELVVKTLASKGNCFGMSTEGIYARKGRSLFGMPIDRFTNVAQLEPEFNVRHCYQVGAGAVWWFVGQYLSGNTHDPKDVFDKSQAAFNRGENPVICIAQKWNFSGAPHCILPVGWHKSGSTWTMDILDPNFPNSLRTLTVDANANTFHYQGASSVYDGGAWSGGRFHYMPFSLLCERPRTPIWDAILLLIAGTVIIFGDDAETQALTDTNGASLDAFGAAGTQRLRQAQSLDGYFVDYRGFAGEAIGGGMLFRTAPKRRLPGLFDPGSAVHASLGELASDRTAELAGLRSALAALPLRTRRTVEGRSAMSALSDPIVKASLSPTVVDLLGKLRTANTDGSYRHTLTGKRDGVFDYLVRAALSSVRVESTIKARETLSLNARDLDSSLQQIGVTAPSDRRMSVTHRAKLGGGCDVVQVKLSNLPVAGNKEVLFSVRPGLGGAEIIGLPEGTHAVTVDLETRTGGAVVQRRYALPLERGARLEFGTAIDRGDLMVGGIDTLFGPQRDWKLLRPQ